MVGGNNHYALGEAPADQPGARSMKLLEHARSALITVLLMFVVIRLAWVTVQPLIMPMFVLLLTICILLMIYAFLFRR